MRDGLNRCVQIGLALLLGITPALSQAQSAEAEAVPEPAAYVCFQARALDKYEDYVVPRATIGINDVPSGFERHQLPTTSPSWSSPRTRGLAPSSCPW